MSKVCRAWKYGHHKKFEKAERAVDGDKDDMVLCSLPKESKKMQKRKFGLWKMSNSPWRLV